MRGSAGYTLVSTFYYQQMPVLHTRMETHALITQMFLQIFHHAVNKNVITVVCAGRPLILKKADQYSKAILYAWHSGIQAGMAAAAILFGEVNPSGRLPVTFPRNAGQIPIYYNHRSPARSIDGYYGGSEYCAYQDESGAPMYPFGYGLSYSEFIYYGLEIKKEGPYVRVSIWVENRRRSSGSRSGRGAGCPAHSPGTCLRSNPLPRKEAASCL